MLAARHIWLEPARQARLDGRPWAQNCDITIDGDPPDAAQREALREFTLAGVLAGNCIATGRDRRRRRDGADYAFGALARAFGLDRAQMAADYPERARIFFDSVACVSGTFCRHHDTTLAHVRGAPGTIIAMCSLQDGLRTAIEHRRRGWADQGFRVFAVAGGEVRTPRVQHLNGLGFLGLVALIAPARSVASAANGQRQGNG